MQNQSQAAASIQQEPPERYGDLVKFYLLPGSGGKGIA